MLGVDKDMIPLGLKQHMKGLELEVKNLHLTSDSERSVENGMFGEIKGIHYDIWDNGVWVEYTFTQFGTLVAQYRELGGIQPTHEDVRELIKSHIIN